MSTHDDDEEARTWGRGMLFGVVLGVLFSCVVGTLVTIVRSCTP